MAQRRDAAVEDAFPPKRGPEAQHNPLTSENEKLRRQNQRLQEELRKAEIIIDVKKSGHAVGSPAAAGSEQRELLMATAEGLGSVVGMKRACQDLSIPRAGIYRRRRRRLSPPPVGARRPSARRLEDDGKSIILACLHKARFQNCSPAQVFASLLDEGRYHC